MKQADLKTEELGSGRLKVGKILGPKGEGE